MNIETSSLAIVISFLAGIIASLLFYFRDKSLKETAKWIKLTLSVCRFFIVFIISFLLFSPLTIKTKEQVKQPVLPVLVDNSKSLNIIDSSFNKDILPFLNRLKDESKNVEVKVIPFSNSLNVGEELTFNKQGTNLSNSITELIENFSNENIGGVVLVSDGISTAGNNILPGAEFPIYTLGVGEAGTHYFLYIVFSF